MNVLIVPSNTDLNRGDQALVWESIRLVQDVFKEDVKISLIGSGDTPEEWYQQNNQTEKLGYQILKPVLKHPGRHTRKTEHDNVKYGLSTLLSWGACAIVDLFMSIWLLSSNGFLQSLGVFFLGENEKRTLKKYQEADAIFVKGGGFIHSYGPLTDIYLMYFLLFHINLGLAFKKPVLVFPNSFGPLKNRFARRMAYHSLKRCTLVTSRESVSNDFLNAMGIESHLFPDLGFYLQPYKGDGVEEYLSNKGVDLSKKNVVMTARPYRFGGSSNADNMYVKYINSYVQLITHLLSKSYGVTLFAHTIGPSTHEDDRIAIRDIVESLKIEDQNRIVIIDDNNLNCKDVENIYSYYDYLVGTRFHSVIFGLNVETPALAIAYGGNKGTGIMKEFDLSDYCIKIEDIEGCKLIDAFESMNRNRSSYISKLREKRIAINEKRSILIEKVRERLEWEYM